MSFLCPLLTPSSQVEYHELQTLNGDSSSVSVSEPRFSMENLQPGRNYSIAVRAVSNNIESVPSTAFQATREETLREVPSSYPVNSTKF